MTTIIQPSLKLSPIRPDISSLTDLEQTYIQACTYLNSDDRLRFELYHLHIDLLYSEPDHRHLSLPCLQALINLPTNVPLDKNLAFKYFERQFDHAPSIHLLAFLRELNKEYQYAFNLYNRNLQYPPSAVRLGIMYHRSTVPTECSSGKKEDELRAFELAMDAQRKGYIHSENFLGSLYDSSRGPTSKLPDQDQKLRATEMFEIAANKGCSCALFNIGLNLRGGKFPYDDIPEIDREDKAYKYFEQAAALMNYGAMEELADMVLRGEGPARYWSEGKRMKQACKWYYWVKRSNWSQVSQWRFNDEQYKTVEQGGIFVQDFFDALFCSGFISEEEDEKLIEGEGFLLYSEKGFNLNMLGSLCQGNSSKIFEIGRKGLVPTYEDFDGSSIENLPEAYKGKELKKSEVSIDLSGLDTKSGNEFIINCSLITLK